MAVVLVSSERVPRWIANFENRHGDTTVSVVDGALSGAAADGSTFAARLPFDEVFSGPADAADFSAAVGLPADWGVLLVRKGGFAMARLSGDVLGESKTGQRHVQGRTKAGGQSQQRFARRRGNQARQAYEAAADHAARILGGTRGPIVTGGDRAAIEEVLADRRLAGLSVVSRWLDVPDPRRAVLEQAIRDAGAAEFEVVNS